MDIHKTGVAPHSHRTASGAPSWIAPKQGIWECPWTTFLKAGQITVQGPFYDTRNSALSITGGTGAYRNTRGEMILRSRHGGKEYDFIFELS